MANNYTNAIDSNIDSSSEIDSKLENVVEVVRDSNIKSISVNGKPIVVDEDKNVDIPVPEKTSDLNNDGDGESPFATEDFVEKSGGKINSISVNGTPVEVDENKNANISIVTEEEDPTVPSFVKDITEQDIDNWNDKATETYVQEYVASQLSTSITTALNTEV